MKSVKLSAEMAERFGLDPNKEWYADYDLPVARMSQCDPIEQSQRAKFPVGAWGPDGELLADFQIVEQFTPVAIYESAESQHGCYGSQCTTDVNGIPVTQYT